MRKLFILISFAFVFNTTNSQNVGIGTSNPQAALDVSSTTQGFLPPRMTIAQRDAIANPVAGLVIFCIDCDELQLHNGTIWKNIQGEAACILPSPISIKICDQVWMLKNLDVQTYRNGDTIPQVTDPIEWLNLTSGAWCWFNNDSITNSSNYGRLYNWYAVNDSRGIAPIGWHIPSYSEFTSLSTCLGGVSIAGSKMTAISSLWIPANTMATNSSGFTGLPSGGRFFNGVFSDGNTYGSWWTSTNDNANDAWNRSIYNNNLSLGIHSIDKRVGLSLRCIKDY